MEIERAEFEQLKNDVAAIKSAIVGNPEMRLNGLAHKVNENSEYIERDRLFKAKAVGMLAALEIAGIAFFEFIFGKH